MSEVLSQLVGGVVLQNNGGGGLFAAFGLTLLLVVFVGFLLIPAIGMWKTFVKAGQPGWGAFVPILNIFYLVEIADRPSWWIAMPFIPVIGWLLFVAVLIDVAKQFGRGPGTGFGLLVLPFIFWPLLGFGDAKYHGDTSPGTTAAA